MTQTLRILLCLCVLTLLPACQQHYHFDKEWRMWAPVTAKDSHVFPKKTEPPPNPESPWDGRWVGHWTSDKHKMLFSSEPGHGDVRCIVSKIDPYRYRANFRAEYETIFHGEYLATLYGHAHGKTLRVKGEWPVSKLFGGSYHYEGTLTPKAVSLRYSSSYDNGTIEMTRYP